MENYKTYQDAKIANPECEIAHLVNVHNKKFFSEFGDGTEIGDFAAVVQSTSTRSGYYFADGRAGSPNITDGYWKLCNPADYCMTVEKFLSDGNEFVSGDFVLGANGRVVKLKINNPSSLKIAGDDKRYILRAAALESKKPRTRVEFVKCDFSQAWEAVKEFEGGQVFYRDANSMIPTNEINYVSIELVVDVLVFHNAGNLYRKVEHEIDWRDDVIDYLESFGGDECRSFIEAIKEYKHTGACNDHFNGFVDMCKLVAKES